MCGILGYYSKNNINKKVFINNLKKINYRGPDNSSIINIEKVMLGHNRLSIIDLKNNSNQPMKSNCERYIIVFNGEIYNYLELKLKLNNYFFKTNSDTEVILAAFSKWGVKCLNKLNGKINFSSKG